MRANIAEKHQVKVDVVQYVLYVPYLILFWPLTSPLRFYSGIPALKLVQPVMKTVERATVLVHATAQGNGFQIAQLASTTRTPVLTTCTIQ